MEPSRIWPDFREGWIVYRDRDLIVVRKPAGMRTQADGSEPSDDLVTRLKMYLASERKVAGTDQSAAPYLGIHQILDRESSGLVLFTLHGGANRCMARQFESGSLEKVYLAAVDCWPERCERATLRHYLILRRGERERICDSGECGAREASIEARRTAGKSGRALLRVSADSGRAAQIRAQLAAAGSAVAGDREHGGPTAPRLMLHALSLTFERPSDGQRVAVEDEPPIEFTRFIESSSDAPYDDLALTRARIDAAVESRWALGRAAPQTTVFRLINAAGDGLPGLAVDLYDRWLVAHFYGEAIEVFRDRLLDLLDELGFRGVYLKRHPRRANELTDMRSLELAPAEPARGSSAPEELTVMEEGMPLLARLADGLRTGLFLDQRENRRRVRETSRGLRVLNLFAYTGGFSAAALAGGAASVVSVDGSAAALKRCERNVSGLSRANRHRAIVADVFDALQRFKRRGEKFDLAIVDPPSYSTVGSRRFRVADDLEQLLAATMRVVAPAGRILASVNLRGFTPRRLRGRLQAAARATGRDVERIRELPPQPDFPFREDKDRGAVSVWAELD